MRQFTLPLILALSACGAGRPDSGTASLPHQGVVGKSYVLTIGIGAYQRREQLASARADANAVQRVLEDHYGYIALPAVPTNATDADIKRALNHVHDIVGEHDRLVIYYSGHGEPGSAGTHGYWLPANAEQELGEHWISRDFIAEQIGTIKATEIIVIDDSCYSGQGTDSDSQDHRASVVAEPLPEVGIAASCANADWPAPRRAVRWLSAARDTAQSGADAQQASAFTRYLLGALNGNTNRMTGNELFERVRERMSAAREQQMPEYIKVPKARDVEGDFLFVPRTWSVDMKELQIGTLTVRAHTGHAGDQSEQDGFIQRIVAGQMEAADARSKPIRPGNVASPLCLSISSEKNKLVMTLVDRSNGKQLASATQVVDLRDAVQFANNIHAAVLNLYDQAANELHGEEISVDIVRKALIAERTQTWSLSMSLGPQAYLAPDGDALLKDPGYSMRATLDVNLRPWLLAGPVLGLDAVGSQTNRTFSLGDLSSGTYARLTFKGTASLLSGVAMGRVTVRAPHGLVLPFGYLSLGVGYFIPRLSNEHAVPMTAADTSPINIAATRSASSSAALVGDVGGGVVYRWSERISVLGEVQLFQAYHDMKVESDIRGFNQRKPIETPFQSIHGVSVRFGIAVNY